MKRFFSATRILRFLLRDSQQDCRLAAEEDPQLALEAAKDRGNAFLNAGEFDRAAQCYQEALRIQSSCAGAEAMSARATALKPALCQIHINLGIAAERMKQQDEAMASYEKAIEIYSDNAEGHWRLGNLLLATNQHERAVDSFSRALDLDSDLAEIRNNLGAALLDLHRFDEALGHFRQALQIREIPVTHLLAGVACEELYLRTPAMEHYRQALAMDSDWSLVRFRLAFILLLLGNYEEGLAHFEQRLKLLSEKLEWLKPVKDLIGCFGLERYWQGQDIAGKQLLVVTEQGLGDSLMMLRYVPLIKGVKGASRLRVMCEPSLESIVRNLPGVDEVRVKPAKIQSNDFDWYCTTMSLPYAFKTRLENIPPAPYLQIPEQKRATWVRRTDLCSGIKVGIAWAGNPHLGADAARSIPLQTLAPLFALSGVSWVSLQKGESAGQLKDVDWPIKDWVDECHDFQDTGALMENLDLIITVDTSVVHLAGALGRPTWLLNRYGSDWRWLLDREVSPWYPTVRIFRQSVAGEWDSVIERIADELRTLTHS